MITADLLARLLKSQIIRYSYEKDLQAGIARVLKDAGIPFVRECAVTGGTIDFMVGDIGLEVKIKGTPAAVANQLVRYSKDPRIKELLLVSTSLKHRSVERHLPPMEKTVNTLILLGSAL